MASYREFPISTVIYNTATLGGAMVVGAVILTQLGAWALASYLLLVLLAVGGIMASVCTRCSYYGHRCALGWGKPVAMVFRKNQADEFFRTMPQAIATLGLLLAMVLPIAGGTVLLIRGYSAWKLAQLAGLVGLLLAGLIRHPRLVCSHCRQGECGACPIGRKIWEASKRKGETLPASEEVFHANQT